MTELLDYADYLWLIGKSYPGRHPAPMHSPDGRTITVLDVRSSHVFSNGVSVLLKDNTGRKWATSYAEQIANDPDLKGD